MSESASQIAQDAILTAEGPEGLSVDPSAILAAHTLRPCRDPDCALPNHRHCRACLDAWQGDPETGGCTARLLAQELVRLQPELDGYMRTAASNYQGLRTLGETLAAATTRAAELEGLLREVEWAALNVDNEECCPVCEARRYAAYGHAPDCRLMAALEPNP